MARRKQLPEDWESIVRRGVAYWNVLDEHERQQLAELAEFIIAAKRWEAANGFVLTDDVVVTIAMEAAVLILGLDASYFGKVTTIIVHPTTFSIPGPHATEIMGMVDAGPRPLLGEAHHDRGPMLLAWDQVRYAARHRGRGRNVVWHEFAHKVDMLDGVVDGTPPMQDRQTLDRWIEVCTTELELLRSGQGGHVLDPYAATDPGEFFAVATETFFDLPLVMRSEKPELYDVLSNFYRQDPASREPAPASSETQ